MKRKNEGGKEQGNNKKTKEEDLQKVAKKAQKKGKKKRNQNARYKPVLASPFELQMSVHSLNIWIFFSKHLISTFPSSFYRPSLEEKAEKELLEKLR